MCALLPPQVLICVHDERTGGELHGASELRKPETQALHLRHAWSGVSVADRHERKWATGSVVSPALWLLCVLLQRVRANMCAKKHQRILYRTLVEKALFRRNFIILEICFCLFFLFYLTVSECN